jgi:hypothetical protein
VCYHDLHPFHDMLHDGKLNKGQVQAWALNRYVYQAAIPRKDASLNRDVHRRELERPVYVDSGRSWHSGRSRRKDAAMVWIRANTPTGSRRQGLTMGRDSASCSSICRVVRHSAPGSHSGGQGSWVRDSIRHDDSEL